MRVEVYIEELPAPSRAWLTDESKTAHVFRAHKRSRLTDTLIALALTGAWGVVAASSVVSEQGFTGWLVLPYAVLALVLTGLMLSAWSELGSSFAARHRRMLSVHPAWLLDVGSETLTARPWTAAGEPHLSGSNVSLELEKKKVVLHAGRKQAAEALKVALEACRARGADTPQDFIPQSMLEPGFRSKVRPKRRAARARRWGYSVACAVVLASTAASVGAVRERERVWAAAVNTGSPAELAKVLEQRPSGEGSERLEGFRRAQLTQTRAVLESTLDRTDPRLVALDALLLSVQTANHPRLSFRTKQKPLSGSTGAQASAFTDSELRASLARFPQRLYDGFSDSMTLQAREVLAVSPGSAERGVTVEVTLTPRLLQRSVQVGRSRWPLLGLSATAVLAGQQLSSVAVELDEGDCVMMSSADSAGEVLDAQMQRLLWKMGGALARSFGLAVEP